MSLKALKGVMFYLPCPLEKTMQTLNIVGIDYNHLTVPELLPLLMDGQLNRMSDLA